MQVDTGTTSAMPLIGARIEAAKSFADIEEFAEHTVAAPSTKPDELGVLALCLLCPRFRPEGPAFVRSKILRQLQTTPENSTTESSAHCSVVVRDIHDALDLERGGAEQRKHLLERLLHLQDQLGVWLLSLEEAEQLSPSAPWPEVAQAAVNTDMWHKVKVSDGKTQTQLWLERLEAAANTTDKATGVATRR